MTTNDADGQLQDVVRSVYQRYEHIAEVSPAWLATEAMAQIGFPRSLHNVGYAGCHLQFRQIARSFCRRHFEPEVVLENDLFPDTLQQRYPRRPTDGSLEPQYILLDLLSPADVAYNIARLRKEAVAKMRHADALEEWAVRRFGQSAA